MAHYIGLGNHLKLFELIYRGFIIEIDPFLLQFKKNMTELNPVKRLFN